MFPIWEFAHDQEGVEGQDETWVRPLEAKVVEPDLYSLSVAADFQTASGETVTGFVGVTTAGTFECGHGVLLHKGKYIFVPSSKFANVEDEWKMVASALRMKRAQVFPLKYTLRVRVQGEIAFRQGEFK